MTIYTLYIKTHNKTGLKYFGTTTAKDPHKYQGSGVDWKLHIKEHGYDCTTEVVRECQTKDERNEWGLYYSILWDIVNSNEWANKIPETGAGGWGIRTPETTARITETKRKNGTLNQTPEAIAKMVEARKLNGTFKRTQESIDKQQQSRIKNGCTNRTPESIAKGLETKRRNGTLKQTPESIAKTVETKRQIKLQKEKLRLNSNNS
jgi:hypothetical protein